MSGDLELRLRQLLGLNATNVEREFVTFSVPLAQLFRPCADPSVDTTRCDSPDFPEGVDDEHVQWLADHIARSWRCPDGYPFTRLGYTFDWSPDAQDRYGALEYVIRGGAPIIVISVEPTETFCQNQ
jgi:hypothetical protein